MRLKSKSPCRCPTAKARPRTSYLTEEIYVKYSRHSGQRTEMATERLQGSYLTHGRQLSEENQSLDRNSGAATRKTSRWMSFEKREGLDNIKAKL